MGPAFSFAIGVSQEQKCPAKTVHWEEAETEKLKDGSGNTSPPLIFTAASPVAMKWASWETDKSSPPASLPHPDLLMHANAWAFSIGFPVFFIVLLCFKQGKGCKSF